MQCCLQVAAELQQRWRRTNRRPLAVFVLGIFYGGPPAKKLTIPPSETAAKLVCCKCFRPGHTHTHPFNGPLSGTTQVNRYQKGKTNLDFTEARDSEWQWHPLGHMLVCTSLHTDDHASTPPLSFLQAGCPSCRPTNSVKALKALGRDNELQIYHGIFLLMDNKHGKLFVTKQSKGYKITPRMHKNTLGGLGPPGPAGGAHALSQTPIHSFISPQNGRKNKQNRNRT